MNDEKKQIEEFEEWWEEQRHYFNYINADSKHIAFSSWLESRRRLKDEC